MISQKPSTFRPFVRQLGFFAAIALLAGYDNIRGVVASAARKWDDMIDMVHPIELSCAVVAKPLLALVLHLYVGLKIRPIGIHSPRFSPVLANSVDVRVGFLVRPIIRARLFNIFMAMSISLYRRAFKTDRAASQRARFSFSESIQRCIFPAHSADFGLCSGRVFANQGTWSVFASLASTMPAGFYALFNAEIFSRGGFQLTALRASLKGRGDIKHRNLLSLHLGIVVGAEPRNSVVRRVINPSLALPYYTSKASVA